MTVNQVSVFLEDKPGHLEHALASLANANVNIVTLTIAETAGFGLLRMIVDQPANAVKALNKDGMTASETPVLAVEIDDKPGSLLAALRGFAERDLNIEYLYTFAERKRPDRIVVIFRFADIDAAQHILREDGFNILRQSDIIGA